MVQASPEAGMRAVQYYLGDLFLVREVDNGSNHVRRLQPNDLCLQVGRQIDVVEQSTKIPSADFPKRLLRGFNVKRIPCGAMTGRLPPSSTKQPLRYIRIRGQTLPVAARQPRARRQVRKRPVLHTAGLSPALPPAA